MTGNWLETAIIIFIMAGIGVAIWKGGAANPEGTGSLGRKLGHVDREVGQLAEQMRDVESRVEHIENVAASKADIKRLERSLEAVKTQVATLGENAAAREATLDHVKHQVDRLYDFIVNKGMSS